MQHNGDQAMQLVALQRFFLWLIGGIEGAFVKLADNTKQRRMANTVEKKEKIPEDLDKFEQSAEINMMDVNRLI